MNDRSKATGQFSFHFNDRCFLAAILFLLSWIGGSRAVRAASDGLPIATFADSLSHPGGMAFDHQGNLLVAETDNNRVLRINAFGLFTTAAGQGSSSDFAPVELSARVNLKAPEDVAVDRAGNLYIADTGNGRVLKVTPDAKVQTVPGLGGPQFLEISGLAVDAFGNLFVADRGANLVWRKSVDGSLRIVAGTGISGFSGDGGPAVHARLNAPSGLALDAQGNLYIADTMNQRIRRVEAKGTIWTVAGSFRRGYGGDADDATDAQLNFPTDVAVDSQGALFIADHNNFRVREVNPDGTIRTLAGIGDLTSENPNSVLSRFLTEGAIANKTELDSPVSVALDDEGSLFIAEITRIRKVAGASLAVSNPSTPDTPSTSNPDAKPDITPVTLDVHPGQRVPFTVPVDGVKGSVLLSGLLYYSGSQGVQAIRIQGIDGVKEAVDVTSVPENGGKRVRLLSAVPLAENTLNVRGTLQIPPDAAEGSRFTLTWIELKALDPDGKSLSLASNRLTMTARILPGDLNLDGRVDVTDAKIAADIVTGQLSPVSPRTLAAADVAPKKTDGTFGDGVVMINDVIRLIRRAIGLERQWP
jgi:sugar lactone lactonase YvrE